MYHLPVNGTKRGHRGIWNNDFPDQSYIKEITLITSQSPEVYKPLCNYYFCKRFLLFTASLVLRLQRLLDFPPSGRMSSLASQGSLH